MGVIRVQHTTDYTVMSNCHLRDDRLSLRAIGLMSKMLSNTDDYQYTVAGLAARCKEGRDAVRKALQELEDAGYLVREQEHGESGKFSANNYVLYEQPQTIANGGAVPLTEKPSTGKPLTENPPQRSTKKEEILNTPPIVPHGGRRAKHEPSHEPEMFERFWRLYPCGKDRVGAVREWDRLKPDRALMQTMSAALRRMMQSEEWQRGIGIPYACRWLSKRRWEDEDRQPAAGAAVPAGPEEGELEEWT